jgi:hypothetical protein
VTSGDAHDSQRLEIATLRAENDRLIALLESHGIEWRTPQSAVVVARELEPSKLSTAEKVALFRRLFRGRTDVYPVRWEGKTSASRATHRPAPTSGAPGSAKSRASNAAIAATAC